LTLASWHEIFVWIESLACSIKHYEFVRLHRLSVL
jgi:hypothetical protein